MGKDFTVQMEGPAAHHRMYSLYIHLLDWGWVIAIFWLLQTMLLGIVLLISTHVSVVYSKERNCWVISLPEKSDKTSY